MSYISGLVFVLGFGFGFELGFRNFRENPENNGIYNFAIK